jgi:hypothetical protein
MALRALGPFDLTNGITDRDLVTPGDRVGSLTIASLPRGTVCQVALAGQAPIPMEHGDCLDRLSPVDTQGGVRLTVPPGAGTITIVVGVVDGTA